jgi:hypothetical protein
LTLGRRDGSFRGRLEPLTKAFLLSPRDMDVSWSLKNFPLAKGYNNLANLEED